MKYNMKFYNQVIKIVSPFCQKKKKKSHPLVEKKKSCIPKITLTVCSSLAGLYVSIFLERLISSCHGGGSSRWRWGNGRNIASSLWSCRRTVAKNREVVAVTRGSGANLFQEVDPTSDLREEGISAHNCRRLISRDTDRR